MRKSNLILGAVLMMAVKSHADLFYTDDNMEITLLEEKCPHEPEIKLAQAVNLKHTEQTSGCWWKGKTDTYVIILDIGKGEFYQYDLYRNKFEFRGAK